jgi:hypothetical protein
MRKKFAISLAVTIPIGRMYEAAVVVSNDSDLAEPIRLGRRACPA